MPDGAAHPAARNAPLMARADRHAAAREIARWAGAEALVASDPGTVHWLTGLAAPLETGPSPFVLPPLAVVAPGNPVLLVVGADDAPESLPDGVVAEVYEGFTTGPLRGHTLGAEALARVLAGRRAAVEAATLPALAAPAHWVDVSREVLLARAVKDEAEVAAIRGALLVCDAGQRRLRETLTPGMSEVELLATVRAAIEVEAGERVELLADLVSGPRTAEMGGPPSVRTVRAGDPVLCDLGPRVGGVWGDSCATVVAGEASAAVRDAHRRVHEALERAYDAVRPGVRAGDADALVRRGLDYPHHTGHGIGGAYHEEPRLVPGSDTVLRPGMVIALEPAWYGDDAGLRLEHVVLVTEDGCEDLSRHELSL